jgi:hypothetical protein
MGKKDGKEEQMGEMGTTDEAGRYFEKTKIAVEVEEKKLIKLIYFIVPQNDDRFNIRTASGVQHFV